jgi:hypothetical protein
MQLSLVYALLILLRAFLGGYLLKGSKNFEILGIKKSVFPSKFEGVKFT